MSALYFGNTLGERIAQRLKDVAKDDYGTSIVSFEEQTRGWLSEIAREKTEHGIVTMYNRLGDILDLYRTFAIWQYTDEASMYFAALRKGGVRIGSPDLRIASIALANNATVLTRNRRDFEKVPNLLVEDWTESDFN